jgi:hypothetical protein
MPADTQHQQEAKEFASTPRKGLPEKKESVKIVSKNIKKIKVK